MLKAFFKNIETPLSFVRLNVDNLQRCLVVDWMGREIAEMPYCVDFFTQPLRNSLLRIDLI